MNYHPDINGQQSAVETWLEEFFTHLFGPRETWSEEVQHRHFQDRLTLILFCQNYKFPPRVAPQAADYVPGKY